MLKKTGPPKSSLRNNIIITLFMIIIIGGILINLSFQYVLHKTLTAEELNEIIIRKISSDFISLSTGLTILGCIVVLIISILISKKITDPIKRLTAGVMEIASGNLSTRIEVTSEDEIGQLTYGFNQMAQELEDALKKSEAQREYTDSIVATIPAILIILNNRFDILSTNISPEKSHYPIKPREVVELLKKEILRCLETEECQTREITLNPKGFEDGITFIAEISMIEKTEEGEARVLITLTDITARKKAEEELKKKIDELERFRKVTVQREFRMEELRRRIRELEKEIKRARQ